MDDSPAGRARGLAAAALELAGRGWPVFPLRPRRAEPAIRDWERRATCDPRIIRQTWEIAPWNVGVELGAAGLSVVDLRAGPRGEHGRQDLAQLAAAAGVPVPADSYTVLTPSDAEQLYLTAGPARPRNTALRLSGRVTAIGAGGYVVGAGSFASGRRYRVVADYGPAPVPPWLAQSMGLRATQPSQQGRQGELTATIDRELGKVEHALPGHQNQALFVAAVRLGRLVNAGGLGEAQMRRALTEAASRQRSPGALSERDIRRAIDAGLRHYAQPRQASGDTARLPDQTR